MAHDRHPIPEGVLRVRSPGFSRRKPSRSTHLGIPATARRSRPTPAEAGTPYPRRETRRPVSRSQVTPTDSPGRMAARRPSVLSREPPRRGERADGLPSLHRTPNGDPTFKPESRALLASLRFCVRSVFASSGSFRLRPGMALRALLQNAFLGVAPLTGHVDREATKATPAKTMKR